MRKQICKYLITNLKYRTTLILKKPFQQQNNDKQNVLQDKFHTETLIY
jgi:hypothetical protein